MSVRDAGSRRGRGVGDAFFGAGGLGPSRMVMKRTSASAAPRGSERASSAAPPMAPRSCIAMALIVVILLVSIIFMRPRTVFKPTLMELRRRALQRSMTRRSLADNSQLLDRAAILRRVPPSGLAFVTLANSAYEELAINWALLLLPLLRSIGAEGHAFLAALDAPLAQALLQRRLPTLRRRLQSSAV